jgi:hypothetical protein
MERLLKSKKFLLICVMAVGIIGLILALSPTEAAPNNASLSGHINAGGWWGLGNGNG